MELMLFHKRFAQKRPLFAHMLIAHWSRPSALLTILKQKQCCTRVKRLSLKSLLCTKVMSIIIFIRYLQIIVDDCKSQSFVWLSIIISVYKFLIDRPAAMINNCHTFGSEHLFAGDNEG